MCIACWVRVRVRVCAAFLWKEAPGDVEGLHDGVKSRCGRAKDVKDAHGQMKCCAEGPVPRLRGSMCITAWHAVMIWHSRCLCARISLALCLCSVMHVHGPRCLLEMRPMITRPHAIASRSRVRAGRLAGI